MKAEVNAKQSNAQTNINIKIYNYSHSNILKTNCTNSQAKKRTLTPPHGSSSFVYSSRFALARHNNLNKKRNKWARGHRVDALTINAPPPGLRWGNRGGTDTTEPKCLEVVSCNLYEQVRAPNKGIGSHLIGSEENTELECCNQTSIFSSETWKRWCQYTHLGPRMMRLCDTEGFHAVGKRKRFFFYIKHFFFSKNGCGYDGESSITSLFESIQLGWPFLSPYLQNLYHPLF